jgi:hypothetical protein
MKPPASLRVLPLMPQPRLAAIVILGISTVTAAGLAYHQYQRAEALTQALAASGRVAASAPTTPSIETPIADATPAAAGPETEIATEIEAAAASPDSENNGDRRRFDRSAFSRRIQELMADPEYAQAFQKQQRARLDGPYADLFAQLNLPPETLNRLQDLMVEKQNAARDVFMAAREEGFSGREDREQLREILELTQSEIDAQIKETIGEQNYALLEAYQETGPQRAVVDRLETRLSYSSTPLNAMQAEALTAIIADTTTVDPSRGGQGSDFGVARGTVTLSDDTMARAQSVLSPDQLQAFVALQEEQAAAQAVSAIMRREARAARGDGGSSRNPTAPDGG